MPYDALSDLPASVKDHLPKHAQEIYRETFNHAFQAYEDAEKRWAAVKKRYEKDEETGRWKRKRSQLPA